MKTILASLLFLTFITVNSQTFNNAEYKKITNFNLITTTMQLSGTGLAVYSYTQKDYVGCIAGVLFTWFVEGMKIHVWKTNIDVFYDYDCLGIFINIKTKNYVRRKRSL